MIGIPIQLIGDQMIDSVYVVDHEEGGDRAFSDGVGGYGSSAAKARMIFGVNVLLLKADRPRIAVD